MRAETFRERAIREASDETRAAVAECMDMIDEFHRQIVPRQPRPLFVPPYGTAADTLCLTCRGMGFVQEDHGYDHGLGSVVCHRCGGRGLKA